MRCCSLVALMLVMCDVAWAQDGAKKTAGGPPASEGGALAGPKVERAAAKRTLVRRDFSGRLERLEMPAEEAALSLLTLTEDEKKNTALVLTERAALMDKAISNNIPMLLKLQGFKEAGRKEQLAMLREWGEVLRPLRAQGKLAEELGAGLSAENAAAMKAMAKEYWDAVIAEGLKGEGGEMSGEGGAKPTRTQVVAKEFLLALGGEIKRSYDRVISSRTGQLEDALKAVEATEEQEAKIKALSLEFFQKSLGKPTAEQKRDFVLKVLGALEPEQRAKLLRELYRK